LNDQARYIALTILASPMLVLKAALRFRRHVHFLRIASAAAIRCRCGRAIVLVGIWKCSCTFTYRGHLLRICPICGRLPRMARCYGCGLTTKLPETPYGATDTER
jgi:hypothetical protein